MTSGPVRPALSFPAQAPRSGANRMASESPVDDVARTPSAAWRRQRRSTGRVLTASRRCNVIPAVVSPPHDQRALVWRKA